MNTDLQPKASAPWGWEWIINNTSDIQSLDLLKWVRHHKPEDQQIFYALLLIKASVRPTYQDIAKEMALDPAWVQQTLAQAQQELDVQRRVNNKRAVPRSPGLSLYGRLDPRARNADDDDTKSGPAGIEHPVAVMQRTIEVLHAEIKDESLWDQLRPETASSAAAMMHKNTAGSPVPEETPAAQSVTSTAQPDISPAVKTQAPVNPAAPVSTPDKKAASAKATFKKAAQKNKITKKLAFDFGDFKLLKNKRYKFPVAFAGTDIALSEIELRILKIAYQHAGTQLSLSRMAEGAYGGETFSGRGALYRSAYALEKRLIEALGEETARRILHVKSGTIRMTPIKAPPPKTPKP